MEVLCHSPLKVSPFLKLLKGIPRLNKHIFLQQRYAGFCIYLIQNSFSKEKYIGCTNVVKRRIVEHDNRHNQSTKRDRGIFLFFADEYFRTRAAEYSYPAQNKSGAWLFWGKRFS
jgi:hypothetical protein